MLLFYKMGSYEEGLGWGGGSGGGGLPDRLYSAIVEVLVESWEGVCETSRNFLQGSGSIRSRDTLRFLRALCEGVLRFRYKQS